MPLVPEFHWCQSLVPVGFNIAHVYSSAGNWHQKLAPATGTRKLVSVNGPLDRTIQSAHQVTVRVVLRVADDRTTVTTS